MSFIREREPAKPSINPLTDVQTYLRDERGSNHGYSLSFSERPSPDPKVIRAKIRTWGLRADERLINEVTKPISVKEPSCS